jgi:hypothetical protein
VTVGEVAGGSSGAAMAMGDLVLTEDELPAVLSKLQEAGVRQTTPHNHLQHESPKVMYLHIEGHGDRANGGLRDALEQTRSKPPTS